jgi:carbon dioxide concentrating mechanism protein CcmO
LKDALGLLETIGLTPTLAAVDAMEKSADVRVIQCELNDFYGVVTKIAGPVSAVSAAIDAGRSVAQAMGGQPVASVIPQSDPEALRAIVSPQEHNPLIQQDVVFFPQYEPTGKETLPQAKGSKMSQDTSLALGLIETQGFTAVFEAIDTACKAANVEVVGKEKLGGGYVTVVIRGELSAVTAAIDAGKVKVEGLGKLIAAHVIARPSPSVLALLPRS